MLLSRVAHVRDDTLPLFTSDQLPEYRNTLLTTYGEWYQPQRRGSRGAYPKPRRRPPPSLLYVQVVKRREGSRVVEVSTEVVFSTPEAVAARLACSPVSRIINTSFVERDNLTQRQSNRRLTRCTNAFSKDLTWFEKQLWLSLAYYHSVLPHKSLQEQLPTPQPTRGAGSPRKWRSVIPAMAAGLTDHVWTTRELLAYRVPIEFRDQLYTVEHLFPEWQIVHHSNCGTLPAFRQAAQSVSRSDSALGSYYRAMRARKEPQQATVATAHRIARIVYHLLNMVKLTKKKAPRCKSKSARSGNCAS